MAFVTLWRQRMRSDRGTLVTWCLTVGLLTWVMVAMYRLMASSGALRDLQEMVSVMPPYIRALLGKGDLDVFGTYVASMEYGGVVTIAFMIYLATYVPGLISLEVDQRSSEFLLGLPVSRRSVVVSRWLGLVTNLLVIVLFQWVVLTVVAGNEAKAGAYLLASLSTFLVNVEVGTLLLLVSIFVDDYSRAVGVSAGVVTFLFFFDSMTENATSPLSWVRKALPYSRIDAATILTEGHVPAGNLAILAVGVAILLCLAVWAFDRKQIGA